MILQDKRIIPVHKTWNADSAKIAPNTYQTDFHVKWINYLSRDGWQPINTELAFRANMFEIQKAPFKAEIPVSATGQAVFESNNRYSPSRKCTVNSPSLSCLVKALDVQDVHGEPLGKDAVVYPNAYKEIEADLILQAYHGRIPRLRKLVCFNKAPSQDIQLRFELELPDDVNETGQINSDLSFASKDDELRAIHLKPARIWDSGNWRWRKKTNLLVTRAISKGRIVLTKHIPATFFEDVVFPVYCDTDFYPNPGVTVDGEVGQYDEGTEYTWAQIIALATGNYTGYEDTAFGFYSAGACGTTDKWIGMAKSFYLFDTSSIPNSDSVTGGEITCTLEAADAKGNGNSWGADDLRLHIVSSNPASNDVLVNGDFDQLGSTGFGTEDYADTSNGNPFTIVLDANGIANISKTGISKFGGCSEADLLDTDPPWASWSYNWIVVYGAEETGADKDPKLSVTHVPQAVTLNRIMEVV